MMRNMLKSRLALAVVLSVVLVLSSVSAVVYANGMPPIIESGEDAATEKHFHLAGLVDLYDGHVIVELPTEDPYPPDPPDPPQPINNWIWGNLMTFTHPGTPNSAAITEWSYENLVGPKGPKRISGSFTIGVGYPDFPDPGARPFIYGPIDGEIFVSFNAQSTFVPQLDEVWDTDHYNFEGTFKIIGGTRFYEGIQGSGTIGGTFHDHTWSQAGDPNETWFDFVMIGQALFPGS